MILRLGGEPSVGRTPTCLSNVSASLPGHLAALSTPADSHPRIFIFSRPSSKSWLTVPLLLLGGLFLGSYYLTQPSVQIPERSRSFLCEHLPIAAWPGRNPLHLSKAISCVLFLLPILLTEKSLEDKSKAAIICAVEDINIQER